MIRTLQIGVLLLSASRPRLSQLQIKKKSRNPVILGFTLLYRNNKNIGFSPEILGTYLVIFTAFWCHLDSHFSVPELNLSLRLEMA